WAANPQKSRPTRHNPMLRMAVNLRQSTIYYGLLRGSERSLWGSSAVGFGHAVDRVNKSCLGARVPPQAGHPTVRVSAMAAPIDAVCPKKRIAWPPQWNLQT